MAMGLDNGLDNGAWLKLSWDKILNWEVISILNFWYLIYLYIHLGYRQGPNALKFCQKIAPLQAHTINPVISDN